ncbi:hypothetical protein [Parasitella parasitica]|uniref:Uncharacterized protein n=1 Tax=Parasitella parasitica TaxID=35722 RepID=A0A0B7NHX2_9FUNG|nr:hypothetical protein [Parasitella parasitica]
MSIPSPSQQHQPQTSVDLTDISTDFGLTTTFSASPTSEQQLSAFMIEVRNRLARLEAAHAEIARLKTALAESEAARHALEAQLAATAVTTTDLASKPSSSRPPPATTAPSASASLCAAVRLADNSPVSCSSPPSYGAAFAFSTLFLLFAGGF